jgi:hypothetical protein
LEKNYELLSHANPIDEEIYLLVHRMQLLYRDEDPVFDQRLVRSCVFDRTKHTETLACEAQESQ